MIIIRLFYAFFTTGLFTVGGGLAALPFLFAMAEKYPWFSTLELTNMIAISQSTPGAIGINMASYAGLKAAGIFGGLSATAGLVSPAFIMLFLIIPLLETYRDNHYVKRVFYTLRPVSAGLVGASGLTILMMSVFNTEAVGLAAINYLHLIVFVLFSAVALFYKKLNPIALIFIAAILGGILNL